jgi:lysyl-tRNA synthetase class 2
MSWRPNSGPDAARARARMLERARDYFSQQGVLEVTTPALSSRTTTDPNISSFEVESGDEDLYLQTSPEHFMKRLLASGYPDIYQLGQVFRYGEVGRRHLPEFTMIEWYRLGFGLQQIIDDTLALAGELFSKRQLNDTDFISYSQAFESALGIDALATTSQELAVAIGADAELSASIGDDVDQWLDLAMATRIAPSFAKDRLTVVSHYPASQASLARLCPDNQSLADRFELYFFETELANGFVELTSANEQLERFEADREKRKTDRKPVPAVDDKLIDALRAGLPDSAGVALGLDRVLMIDEGHDDIRQVTTFTPG